MECRYVPRLQNFTAISPIKPSPCTHSDTFSLDWPDTRGRNFSSLFATDTSSVLRRIRQRSARRIISSSGPVRDGQSLRSARRSANARYARRTRRRGRRSRYDNDDDVDHEDGDDEKHERDGESPDPRNVRSHSAGASCARRVLPHLERCAAPRRVASLPRVRGSKVTTRATGQCFGVIFAPRTRPHWDAIRITRRRRPRSQRRTRDPRDETRKLYVSYFAIVSRPGGGRDRHSGFESSPDAKRETRDTR